MTKDNAGRNGANKSPEFVLNRETLPIVEQMAQQLPGGFVLYREDETRDILFVNRELL